MPVLLRSQIQESEAIRQTQAIEHICIAADRNRDCALLMRRGWNTAKYLTTGASAVEINNELKKIISSSVSLSARRVFHKAEDQPSVISHRSLAICH
ncbi:hypothetical protein [Microcoleus sp. bin38.metabat.b11b12b14.051]|uniref:hypothetical protein n=1 Tax=Microcoleus sp. bin38.metabat.b11b12b14.051 TaxID=2742709 RepID=UPI0025CFBA5B|nr:hypothetical protein [Microcoleus sp. bin38.metabat.b11b12b14.051]